MVGETMEEKRTRAADLLAGGKSKAAAAREVGVNINTMMTWFPPESAKADLEQRAQMQALRDEGLNNSEIAQQLGVSRQRVYQVVGPPPKKKRRSPERARLVITSAPDTFDAVRAIAKNLGLKVNRGEHASEGSIAVLLERIASGELEVRWK